MLLRKGETASLVSLLPGSAVYPRERQPGLLLQAELSCGARAARPQHKGQPLMFGGGQGGGRGPGTEILKSLWPRSIQVTPFPPRLIRCKGNVR